MRVIDRPPVKLKLPILLIALVTLFSLGCGGPASQGDGTQPDGGPGGIPELTKQVIDERINEAWVGDVAPESGTGNPINWSFDEDEPKEITVVDQKIEGDRAQIVLDVKTESSPRASNRRVLAGRISTEWELKTGWVLRRWEIVHTENISMKYRDVPKPQGSPPPLPPVSNSNR